MSDHRRGHARLVGLIVNNHVGQNGRVVHRRETPGTRRDRPWYLRASGPVPGTRGHGGRGRVALSHRSVAGEGFDDRCECLHRGFLHDEVRETECLPALT